MVVGNLVFVSGQVPVAGGEMQLPGRVGEDLSAEDGQQAARLCALGLLAQLKAAAGGDLDRVSQIIRLGGFVNCTADFTELPLVMNGASNLMVEVFGESGRSARSAVGMGSLPGNIPVEVEVIVGQSFRQVLQPVWLTKHLI